jgi:hypothetical protein
LFVCQHFHGFGDAGGAGGRAFGFADPFQIFALMGGGAAGEEAGEAGFFQGR